jgi:hypothetical protein
VIGIECPRDPPNVTDLMKALDGQVPDGIRVLVDVSVGRQIDAGVVGAAPLTPGRARPVLIPRG